VSPTAARPIAAAIANTIRYGRASLIACAAFPLGEPDSHQSSAAAASTPVSAPAVSIARCRPNARPRWLTVVASAISASRGLDRRPLPTRSIVRPSSTSGHDVATASTVLPTTGRP
jgi:hypothetical protein